MWNCVSADQKSPCVWRPAAIYIDGIDVGGTIRTGAPPGTQTQHTTLVVLHELMS